MKSSPVLILMLCALFASSGCSRDKTEAPPTLVQEGSKSGGVAESRFTTIRVDARTERVELFLRDDAGHAFRHFDQFKSWLAGKNKQLRFAMNAGMYQEDLSPLGLFVQDGKQVSRLNLSDGTGNFYLKPNGVFFVSDPRVVESTEFPTLAQGVRLATQSALCWFAMALFIHRLMPRQLHGWCAMALASQATRSCS